LQGAGWVSLHFWREETEIVAAILLGAEHRGIGVF